MAPLHSSIASTPESPLQKRAAKKQRMQSAGNVRLLNKLFVKAADSLPVNPVTVKATTCESERDFGAKENATTPMQIYISMAKENVERQKSKLRQAIKQKEDVH